MKGMYWAITILTIVVGATAGAFYYHPTPVGLGALVYCSLTTVWMILLDVVERTR